MSGVEQLEAVAHFQAVTGVETNIAQDFLSRNQWKLEPALSAYFEAGLDPPKVLCKPVVEVKLPQQPQTKQEVEEEPDDFYDVGLYAQPWKGNRRNKYNRSRRGRRRFRPAPQTKLPDVNDDEPPPIPVDIGAGPPEGNALVAPQPLPDGIDIPMPQPNPEPIQPPSPGKSDSGEELPVIDETPGPLIAVPLQSMSVDVKGVCMAAQVRVVQHYVNTSKNPMLVSYKFRQNESAVYALRAQLNDGEEIQANIMAKQLAKAAFRKAIQEGKTAHTMHLAEDPDAFSLKLGRLDPGASCIITIEFATEMDTQGGAMRLRLPIFRNRILKADEHAPAEVGKEEVLKKSAAAGLKFEAFLAAASKITAVRTDSPHAIDAQIAEDGSAIVTLSNSELAGSIGSELVLLVDSEKPTEPVCILEEYVADENSPESLPDAALPDIQDGKDEKVPKPAPPPEPQPPIVIPQEPELCESKTLDQEVGLEKEDPQQYLQSARAIAAAPRAYPIARKIRKPISKPKVLEPKKEEDMVPEFVPYMDKLSLKVSENEKRVMMLSFIPDFEAAADKLMDKMDDSLSEVILLIDQSGSMAGGRIKRARLALQLFLRSLPPGNRFNVIGFGDAHKYRKLFPVSQEYNDESLAAATAFAAALEPDLGGTDLLSPLAHIFSAPRKEEYPQQIIIVTDGEVKNTAQVLNFVKANALNRRIFTLGIGSEASCRLVTGIARLGGGISEFVQGDERLDIKVLRLLKFALQPVLRNVKVDASSLGIEKFVPKQVPSLFDGQRLIMYGYLSNIQKANGKKVHPIHIVADCGKTKLQFTCQVHMDDDLVQGSLVHRLAARALIREIEDQPEINSKDQDEIRRIGITYGILSSETSFYCEQPKPKEKKNEGVMKFVDVDENTQKNLQSIGAKKDQHDAVPVDAGLVNPAESPDLGQELYGVGADGEPDTYALETEEPLFDPANEKENDSYALEDEDDSYALEDEAEETMFEPEEFQLRQAKSEKYDMGRICTSRVPEQLRGDFMAERALDLPSGGYHKQKVKESRSVERKRAGRKSVSHARSQAAPAPAPTMSAFTGAPGAMMRGLGNFSMPSAKPAAEMRKTTLSPVEMAKDASPVTRICLLQNANGSWKGDDTFEKTLAIPSGAVDILITVLLDHCKDVDPSILRQISATAIAICVLDVRYQNDRMEWELVVRKANRFLRQQFVKIKASDSFTVASLLDAAKKQI